MSCANNRLGRSGLLIFLGWLMYATSYLGKVNYSANIIQVMEHYDVTKPEAGAVPTFFFFAYGVGQIVNGLLCKKYNMKWMIAAALAVSGAINLIIGVSDVFSIVKWLWMVNGFTLSILWPTLIRLLSSALPRKALGKSSVIIGTTVAAGTLVIYALSALYVSFDGFKLAFYTAAIADFAVSIFWILLYDRAVSLAIRDKTAEDYEEIREEAPASAVRKRGVGKDLLVIIVSLCFCAVAVNLIKDGLTTWVPSILKDVFDMTDSLSILLTLFLPIVAIFGNAFALVVHKKIPDYVTHCVVVFLCIAAFIGVIVGSLSLHLAIVMLLSLIVVSFFAASLNSVITSIFPMFMRDKVDSGFIAGILNGCCYLGSTLSAYGLGVVAEYFGWGWMFGVLIGFCGMVALVWCLYKAINGKKVAR